MTLFFTMLPMYILGNLHCLGMCGPLVVMLGEHTHRLAYFFGRTLSFTLAGMVAGGFGSIFNLILHHYRIPALASFAFALLFFIAGIHYCFEWRFFGSLSLGQQWISKKLAPINKRLSLLLLQDDALPVFLFGFLTLALPCGQTLLVFSACALSGDIAAGAFNGFAFAILTSPSLFFAMNAMKFLQQLKSHYNWILGIASLLVALITLCRGLAEMELIPHWIISERFHIIIF
jgi:sulfite exporter TauE/SafE